MSRRPEATSKPFIVLLVDDEHQIRGMLRHLLLKDGCFQVVTASDAGDALALSSAYEGDIDILVTDIDMGAMNGIELYRRIKEQRPNVRVLFISGKAEGFRNALPDAPLLESRSR